MTEPEPIDITDQVVARIVELDPHLVARAEAEVRLAMMTEYAQGLEAAASPDGGDGGQDSKP